MGGHDDSGSSEKKSIGVANDVPTFNAENMQSNMKAVYYCRTFMCIIGGVVAGILGFTGLTGFVFYFLVMAITSVGLIAKMGFSIHSYFDSWNQIIFDGILGGLMVGTYFVRQYYQVLQQQPNFVHQFYNEAGTMLRIDGNSRETATAMLNDHDPSKLVAETPCELLRVVIDNNTCKDATVIQVDSVNKHGILLEVVQVLTDLNLVIRKAYISSDGGWFMDVFNVVDQDGNKIRDEGVINYIQKKLSWFCYPLCTLPKHFSQRL